MARPQKTGLEYFPLDCHMSDEVNLIIADYGIEGYGVLVSMFQLIYGENGYYTDWTLREKKLFSRRVGLSQDTVVSIIDECLEWGIFDNTLYQNHSILTSKRIQRHYSTTTYKRKGTVMLSDYLLINISDKPHINHKPSNNGVTDDRNKATTIVTDDESTQSKVQYSKVQKSTKKNSNVKKITKAEKFKTELIELAEERQLTDEIKIALSEFIEHRKQIKKPMSILAVKKLLTELYKISSTDVERIEILDKSISNGWQGIFALSKKSNQSSAGNPFLDHLQEQGGTF